MDVAAVSLIWILACGAAGGAVNILFVGKYRFLPAIEVRPPGASHLIVLGLVGNVAVAGVAALLAWATIGGYGRVPLTETGSILVSLAYAGIGFLCAHWATAEYDKVLLRRAVCKAAMAPAANPETVRSLFHAPPDQVYDIVDALMPRRADHR